MTPSASAVPPSVAAVMLPIANIVKSPTNPRKHFNEAALTDLAASIVHHGVLQPILVRKWTPEMKLPPGKSFGDMIDCYEIVCGERRWRASQIGGLETIHAMVRDLTDLQVLEMQVVENLQREDVHPLEEAEGYERLIKHHGYTADTLGEKVGKSRAYIYARLKLLAMAPGARELFFDGKLTASTALLIARIPGAALQIKAAAEITKPTWQGDVPSYRAAAEIIQSSYTLGLDEATFKPDDAKLVPEAGSCTDCLKRSGNDRVLFADIEDADVCTDPKCFDNKREVNYLRLRDIAEKSGKEVITGKPAQEMLINGTHSLRQHNLESLDAQCHDDPEHRTYREILGKSAAGTTFVEHPRKKTFVEAIDTKVLAAALKKAGFAPKTTTDNSPSQDDWEKKRAGREAKTKSENAWRARLFQAVRVKLGARFAESKVLAPEELTLLAVNLFQRNAESDYNDIDAITGLWGHHLPEDCGGGEYEAAIASFCEFLITLSAAELCLFLVDLSLIDEAEAQTYEIEAGAQPKRLLAQAKRLGIDPESLRETPPIASKAQPKTAKAKAAPTTTTTTTPTTPAAQASEKKAAVEKTKPEANAKAKIAAAKKPAAKADSAPAKPATEPAAPVEKLAPTSTWPFPIGTRPAKAAA